MESKSTLIKRLNPSETEVFKELLRDPSISATALAKKFYRKPASIRTNITSIYKKLRVPPDVDNKREWLVKEYGDVFKRGGLEDEPKIFIKPPDPILLEPTKTNTTKPPDTIPIDSPKPQPTTTQPPPFQPTFKLEPTKIHTSSRNSGNFITFFVVVIIGTILLILALNAISNFSHQDDLRATQKISTILADIAIAQANTATAQAKKVVTAPAKNVVSAVASSTPIFTGPVLFFDNFNTGKISPKWEINWTYDPLVADGMVYVDENKYTVMSVGDKDWVNYAIFTSIHIKGCAKDQGISMISVGVYVWGSNIVYRWSPCDYPVGSVLDIVIEVKESRYTVYENRQKVKSKAFNTSQEGRGGGVNLYLYEGSAIDYVGVEKLR